MKTLLGIDLGTSSIKVSLVDSASKELLCSEVYPKIETEISSPQPGWAEQSPETWWNNIKEAINLLFENSKIDSSSVEAIGIAYQMHGLVMVDESHKVLRPAIIWCDSRATEIGQEAFNKIGHENALKHLLNSPGNFTASKLAWVKKNEPEIYKKCFKFMLPGDYVAMKFSGEISSSVSSISEGIFWDFLRDELSNDIIEVFGFNRAIFPELKDVFSVHCKTSESIEKELGISKGTPITYKAGDQPNNALSLKVFKTGDIAATAGTSGVIYAVDDVASYDSKSRINSFAHVNYIPFKEKSIGILMCINGTGILNRWTKNILGDRFSYQEMNEMASKVPAGSNGLIVIPFGNGAERIFENRQINASIQGIDFNIHKPEHIIRAEQEGIAFSFNYGLEIMISNGLKPKVIKAGKTNMFLSEVFTKTLANITQIPIELYETDGAKGAALAAGYGLGLYKDLDEAFNKLKKIDTINPDKSQFDLYLNFYKTWKKEI